MSRTTPEKVRTVIQADLATDLAPYIETATALTDHVASQDTSGVLNSGLLIQIETYLAAHYYACFDPQYRSKNTGDASATFIVGEDGKGLAATIWGQQAIALDLSGTLGSIQAGKKKLTAYWLGKTTQEKLDFNERNL